MRAAARHDNAAWTAGWVYGVASPTPPTGHRSPPQHLECWSNAPR